jgi:ATP-dependent RNA circularization protein (DNA/RNA ligase family)
MYTKYPRTFHLPWSQGITSDDKVIKDCSKFFSNEIVILEKMDGENTTMYPDHIHARSIDSKNHTSRDFVKSFWNTFKHDIPKGFRICGENLYMEHSIHYSNLSAYFQVFNIWNNNICLSFDDTVEWCNILGLHTVPVLYRGTITELELKQFHQNLNFTCQEGYVIRLASSFLYNDFGTTVAKFVRKDHVNTDAHVMLQYNYKTNEVKQ